MATTTIDAPRREGLSAAEARATWLQRVLTVVTFVAIYYVLLKVLHLNLIFTRTTASGGDMGSHHYIDAFLRKDLLPHGNVTGWAPGWYAGIPMLTFYFPLPYVLIAALTPLLGNPIAFKLVTASGLLLLPLTCWGAFKILRLREPAPLLAAVASVVFMFMTQLTPSQVFQIYGGNVASTMAGEFPFALSFALLPLAFALLYRAVEEGKGWRAAALVISGVVLSHILSTIALVLGSSMLLLRLPLRDAVTAGLRLLRVLAVAFCITAFWALPFLLRQRYTAQFGWTQLADYGVLLPTQIRPYLILTAIGLAIAIARGERRVLLFAWPGLVAAVLFVALVRFMPKGSLWNARLLPFIYLCSLLVAAYGAAMVLTRVVEWVQLRTAMPMRLAYGGVALVLLLVPLATSYPSANRQNGYLPGWTQYNYSGFEAKPGWPQAAALFRTLDSLPTGRVMWEFRRDEYERFGTTRTLENIPVFTHQPSMEGLLIESSLNAPFHFINQAETSVLQTDAVPGIDYPPASDFPADFPTGLAHLRAFGVRWYVAYSDTAKRAAAKAGLPVAATSGHFTIYQVGSGELVEVPKYRPVLTDTHDWRATALDWYGKPGALDTPLAFASGSDPAARAAFAPLGSAPVTDPPKVPLDRPGEIPATQDNGVVDFTTDRIGEPHIVKVSYFPNWHAEGAKGPWQLSPGLMVVIPTQAHVRLVYRATPIDTAGKTLSVLGLAVVALPPLTRRLRPKLGPRLSSRLRVRLPGRPFGE
jgi:hypothetical protein